VDLVPLIFYGVICALLGALVPQGMRTGARLGLGAAIGVAAAALLPILRSALGV